MVQLSPRKWRRLIISSEMECTQVNASVCMSSKLMLESFRTVWSIPALGYLVVVWMKETVVGRRNKNQFTRKKGKKDNYCRWSVDIESFEYTGFKQQWIMTIYIVLYNKGIQIIYISLCRVEMISIQIFHLCDKLFGKWIFHNKAHPSHRVV